MDPVLGKIDQLLEDEALYQLIRNDFAKRYLQTEQTGRNSAPVEEVILRSLVLRQFCRVYLNEVLDDTTLIQWAALVQPETLEQFN